MVCRREKKGVPQPINPRRLLENGPREGGKIKICLFLESLEGTRPEKNKSVGQPGKGHGSGGKPSH